MSRRVTGICLGLMVAIGYGLSCGPNAHAADVAATDSEEDRVGFVNDYATDEEIERYGLKEIWDRYNPGAKGFYWLGARASFTVDRKAGVFLQALSQGTGEKGSRTHFLLWWQGKQIRVALDLAEGSSKNLDDRPFVCKWSLASLDVPQDFPIAKEKVIEVVKMAVSVYGYMGASKQIPDTDVMFDF